MTDEGAAQVVPTLPTVPAVANAVNAPSPEQVAQLQALGDRVRAAVAAEDYEAALQAAHLALQMVPGHPVVLADVALCHMRCGRFAQALPAYEQAARGLPGNENIADGLTECYGRLGRGEDVAKEGRRALSLKAAQVAGAQGWPLPAGGPPPFDGSRPERNLVAFTLFGDNPRYCETAVLNIAQAQRWLPGWTCRFYVDARVPAAVLERLSAGGAQCVDMSQHPVREAAALTWRFLVLDEPGVDRFLLRDADSLVSAREAGAVNEWLRSDRWFHLMRDTYTHSELLLAGMWGGCGGVFKDIAKNLVLYSRQPPRLSARVLDQQWLREYAWPTVRQSVMSHDSAFAFDGGLPFPIHERVDLGDHYHVGGDICPGSVGGPSAAPDGATVYWRLINEAGAEVCRYASVVRNGAWRAHLPRPYTMALQAGQWRCQVAG
jgi:hypothetical protein